MEALFVIAATFVLLWVLFILPQQRRVRAHQQLVASLQEGDEVILSAGIRGRITALGVEELALEVAPGVELRVARQAVLRRVESLEPLESSGVALPIEDIDEGAGGDAGADIPPGDDTGGGAPPPPTPH